MKTLKVIDHRYFFFFDKTIELQVPERWEDLNDNQFTVCAGIYVDPLSDIDFISQYFGIDKRVVKQISKFEQYKLTELASFVVKPTGTVNFFYIDQIPGTKLLSPGQKLRGVTFEHFALFDTYFFDYVNDPTEANLRTFVAAVYLKKGDRITDIDFEKHVNLFARKVDKMTLYAIFLNYVFLRDWLSKAFPSLFQKSDSKEDDEDDRKIKPQKKPSRPDWNSMLDGVVGENILEYDSYKALPCIQLFKLMNKHIKEFKRNGRK